MSYDIVHGYWSPVGGVEPVATGARDFGRSSYLDSSGVLHTIHFTVGAYAPGFVDVPHPGQSWERILFDNGYGNSVAVVNDVGQLYILNSGYGSPTHYVQIVGFVGDVEQVLIPGPSIEGAGDFGTALIKVDGRLFGVSYGPSTTQAVATIPWFADHVYDVGDVGYSTYDTYSAYMTDNWPTLYFSGSRNGSPALLPAYREFGYTAGLGLVGQDPGGVWYVCLPADTWNGFAFVPMLNNQYNIMPLIVQPTLICALYEVMPVYQTGSVIYSSGSGTAKFLAVNQFGGLHTSHLIQSGIVVDRIRGSLLGIHYPDPWWQSKRGVIEV